MASYTDAFHFTPDQFLQLTLPQLSEYASYAEKRDEEMKRSSKSQKPGSSGTVGKTSSFEQLVHQFGSPEVKAKLLNNG